MKSRLARWRLRRHQLEGFRRDGFFQMWEPVESSEGLWARPRFNVDPARLPDRVRERIAALDQMDPVQALSARGWMGLSSGTNPDFYDVLQLARQVLVQNGISRSPPVIGLSFDLTFNAGFFPGVILGAGAFLSLNAGLLLSLDLVNEWVLGSSDIHFGDDESLLSLETCYLNALFHSLPYMLGMVPHIWGTKATKGAFDQAFLNDAGFQRYARMGYMIAMTQKIWIVLHEFAHWHLGHRGMTGMGSHRQEYEADRQALLWLLESETNHGLLFGMVPSGLAIPTLLSVLRCAERLYSTGNDTHPSFEERWRNITSLDEVDEDWADLEYNRLLFDYLSQSMEDIWTS